MKLRIDLVLQVLEEYKNQLVQEQKFAEAAKFRDDIYEVRKLLGLEED